MTSLKYGSDLRPAAFASIRVHSLQRGSGNDAVGEQELNQGIGDKWWNRKNKLWCQRSLQRGVAQIFSQKSKHKGNKEINYPAVVPALSGPGSCDPMNNSELKIFASIFLSDLTRFNCESHWRVISIVKEIYSITNRYFILLCWPRCSSVKAFLICRNSQEKLGTQTAGGWAAAGAGEQRALPMSRWWFWWQVFGIVGWLLKPRDHGQTSVVSIFVVCRVF